MFGLRVQSGKSSAHLSLEYLEDRLVPATYIVDDNGDAGAGAGLKGDLRYCITQSNAAGGNNSITFALPAGKETITLGAPLPAISKPSTVLDGTTQAGYQGAPLVTLSGDKAGAGAVGLSITSISSTVKGLRITGFDSTAIVINGHNNPQGQGGNTIVHNVIENNKADGVLIHDSQSNIIGGLKAAGKDFPINGNLISGNGLSGVVIEGGLSAFNQVWGNYIGVDLKGAAAQPNTLHGVVITTDANRNTVGGTMPGGDPDPNRRNVITGNKLDGINIFGAGTDAKQNIVSGNYIGATADATKALGNRRHGVRVVGANDNVIGAKAAPNLIVGNDEYGVQIDADSSRTQVVESLIGTDKNGKRNADFANKKGAIDNQSKSTTFARNILNGGPGPAIRETATSGTRIEGNTIFGSELDGVVLVDVDDVEIEGNFVGTDEFLAPDLGNEGYGIRIEGESTNVRISGNTIAYNGDDGISDSVGATSSITANTIILNEGDAIHLVDGSDVDISENYLGTDDSGTPDLGNSGHAIWIDGEGSDVTISDNIIAYNGGDGIYDAAGASDVILYNTVFLNGGDGIHLVGGDEVGLVENYVGTDELGTLELGNTGYGILIEDSEYVSIGDSDILSNGYGGIRVDDSTGLTLSFSTIDHNLGDGLTLLGGSDHLIVYNDIGTELTGNYGHGIYVGAADGGQGSSGNFIGGNLIAGNGGAGVVVAAGLGNEIIGNPIYANGDIGIDLGDDGVTPNDPDGTDNDTGPNNLQNKPVLSFSFGGTQLDGLLPGAVPGMTYKIELFVNYSGLPEGEVLAGFQLWTYSPDPYGNYPDPIFGFLVDPGEEGWFTVTVTDANGNTSEFADPIRHASSGGGGGGGFAPMGAGGGGGGGGRGAQSGVGSGSDSRVFAPWGLDEWFQRDPTKRKHAQPWLGL